MEDKYLCVMAAVAAAALWSSTTIFFLELLYYKLGEIYKTCAHFQFFLATDGRTVKKS